MEFCEVVVAGHICLDIHPILSDCSGATFDQVFLPGRLINTGLISFSTGGPVSNTGLALHRLGNSTRLVGKVGDDLFGQVILDLIKGEGVYLADGMVIDPACHTSYSIIINYPGTDRIFLHYPGANDTFTSDDIPYQLLEKASLFHFGYPPIMYNIYRDNGVELEELFHRAKQTGVTTSLDMAFPDPSSDAGKADWTAILSRTLPWVDIFLPSAEEILFMLHRNVYESLCTKASGSDILPLVSPGLLSDLASELIAFGSKIVGFKLGDRGFYLRTTSQKELKKMGRTCPADPREWANRELWAPCFQVKVAGTTGSGDATIAGFLSALLRGLTSQQAVSAAVAVGACNVEAEDALSGIRSWKQTMVRISNGWERHSLTINTPGWEFDSTNQMWIGPAVNRE